MNDQTRAIDTKLIHAGEPEPRIAGAVTMPVFQSSTFHVDGDVGYHDQRYIRLNNTPNHHALGVCPRNGRNRRDRDWVMVPDPSRARAVPWESEIREVAGLAFFPLVTAERAGTTIPLPVPQAAATC